MKNEGIHKAVELTLGKAPTGYTSSGQVLNEDPDFPVSLIVFYPDCALKFDVALPGGGGTPRRPQEITLEEAELLPLAT